MFRSVFAVPRTHRAIKYILLAVMAVLIMSLAACGGSTQPAAGATDAPSSPTDSGNTATSLPDSAGPSAIPATDASVSFSKDILPILQSRCVNCHGGQRTEKNLELTSYANIMAGSENGVVVVPGDPAGSKLIELIQQGKMPKRGPKVLPDQLQLLIDWVQAGAPNN